MEWNLLKSNDVVDLDRDRYCDCCTVTHDEIVRVERPGCNAVESKYEIMKYVVNTDDLGFFYL